MTAPQYDDSTADTTEEARPRLVELATEEEAPEDTVALGTGRTRVELEDGSTWVCRITNREYVAWDKYNARAKVGNFKEVPFIAATYLAWRASVREERTALKFDTFCDLAVDVRPLDVTEADDIPPTQ